RADEELRGIEDGEALGLEQLVEVSACSVQLVLEEVGERDDASAPGLKHVHGVLRAAATAAEEATPHGGVGLAAAQGRGRHDYESGGCGGGAQKRSAVQLRGFLLCGGFVRHGILLKNRFEKAS